MRNNYNMVITITDGKEVRHMHRQATFFTDADDYGNGTYLRIAREDDRTWYDLRYEAGYRPNRQIARLAEWANAYWSGEDEAWQLVGLQITKQEGE